MFDSLEVILAAALKRFPSRIVENAGLRMQGFERSQKQALDNPS